MSNHRFPLAAIRSKLRASAPAARGSDKGVARQRRCGRSRADQGTKCEPTGQDEGAGKKRHEHPGCTEVADGVPDATVMAFHDRSHGGESAYDNEED